jgi:DNA-binding response OmpR family regulator
MPLSRTILLVEPDVACGRALAEVLRRGGDRVRVVRTSAQAVQAAARQSYDLAVVDLLIRGGGVELARKLSRRVPRLYLSVGARLLGDEILETALGFPVVRKARVHAHLARPRGPTASKGSGGPRSNG